MHPLLLPLALALDLAFRDAEPWPHPVRLLGRILERLEIWARSQRRLSLRASGVLSLLFLSVLTCAAAWFLTRIPVLGAVASLYLIYSGISLAGLLGEARRISDLADSDMMVDARRELGMLVSRDTSGLDREGIYRTLAETVSENINDGYVAPVFYLLLGGPVFLWLYKAISTMDSMWGYRTRQWADLGWAAARSEDLLAYLPARISYLLAVAAAWIMRGNWREALFKSPADAAKMESPNAGWPMAACAWSVGAGMGGPTAYFGRIKQKPGLGPSKRDWSRESLQDLFRLVLVMGLVWTGLVTLLIWLAW